MFYSSFLLPIPQNDAHKALSAIMPYCLRAYLTNLFPYFLIPYSLLITYQLIDLLAC